MRYLLDTNTCIAVMRNGPCWNQGNTIGPYDFLLAGQALACAVILVTANTKEFSRVPGLILENWQA
jgi:tRNA(fMet)-specific endonuclease VapC